jgi:glutamate dehydrogenase (NADP+)
MTLNYEHEVKIKQNVIDDIYGKSCDYDKIKKCFTNLSIPERIIIFKVIWEDDKGILQINTGYRVQHNSALGPYKGGLRFASDVTLDTFKSLAFEQTFKNSITGLPMGGAKGGSDFSPIGKSESEIRKFCYAFTDELYKYIGPDTDVPAGDIGVGATEVGYIFGRYKQLTLRHDGALTGKNVYGSVLRPEATGYGLLYFVMNNMKYILSKTVSDLSGKKVLISGSGNVAIHAIKKAMHLKATVLTASDITGVVYAPKGIDTALFDVLYGLYESRKLLNSYKDYSKHGAIFTPLDTLKTGENLWNQLDKILDSNTIGNNTIVDIALTCATQHEIDSDSMTNLIKRSVLMVAEGSNFGLTDDAIKVCREKNISYIPGKLSNSGGVMCSHFEMQQNSIKHNWTEKQVDKKLAMYVKNAYEKCKHKADQLKIPFDVAVFIVGFERLMDAMNKLGYNYYSNKQTEVTINPLAKSKL